MSGMGNLSLNVSSGIAAPWYQGDWYGGITGPFINSMGQTGFTAIMMLWIVGCTWIFTRSISMTFVVFGLICSKMAFALPGQGQVLGWMILVIVTAFALFKLYARSYTR
jgi:hypothetical protein